MPTINKTTAAISSSTISRSVDRAKRVATIADSSHQSTGTKTNQSGWLSYLAQPLLLLSSLLSGFSSAAQPDVKSVDPSAHTATAPLQKASTKPPVNVATDPPQNTSTKPSIQSELLALYPESPKYKPFNTFYLKVPGGHEIYIEQVGNPKGNPVIFLHGGPGYWFTEANKRLFNPDVYHIILFDQHGSNRSKPLGRLERNTAEDIIAAMEKIRTHKNINVPKWNVFGGSWGALLGRKYVAVHPESVSSLILRALPPDKPEPRYKHVFGTSKLMYPERYKNFMKPIAHSLPPGELKHTDILNEYFKLFTSNDRTTQENAVRSFDRLFVSNVIPPKDEETVTDRDIAGAQIDCWYRMHDHFIKAGSLSNQEQVNKIPDVPICIIHGHLDLITPYKTSHELYNMLLQTPGRNKTNVYFASVDAGHAAGEPLIQDRLMRALIALPEKLKDNSKSWSSLMGL